MTDVSTVGGQEEWPMGRDFPAKWTGLQLVIEKGKRAFCSVSCRLLQTIPPPSLGGNSNVSRLDRQKSIFEGFVLIWSKNGFLLGPWRLPTTIVLYRDQNTIKVEQIQLQSTPGRFRTQSWELACGVYVRHSPRMASRGGRNQSPTHDLHSYSTALQIHPPICKAIPRRLSNENRCQLILCPYVQHLLITQISLLPETGLLWMVEC